MAPDPINAADVLTALDRLKTIADTGPTSGEMFETHFRRLEEAIRDLIGLHVTLLRAAAEQIVYPMRVAVWEPADPKAEQAVQWQVHCGQHGLLEAFPDTREGRRAAGKLMHRHEQDCPGLVGFEATPVTSGGGG